MILVDVIKIFFIVICVCVSPLCFNQIIRITCIGKFNLKSYLFMIEKKYTK